MSRKQRHARTLSEKKRAFLALRGELFPRVGQVGELRSPDLPDSTERWGDEPQDVVVERLSASGQTIWTRMLLPDGERSEQLYRWYRIERGDSDRSACGTYINGGDLSRGAWELYGEVIFPGRVRFAS